VVNTRPDFSLDFDAIERAISEKTRAVLINSPNNPTGKVYSNQDLGTLGNLLDAYSRKRGEPIYLISDEPYRKIVYDGISVPVCLMPIPRRLWSPLFQKTFPSPVSE